MSLFKTLLVGRPNGMRAKIFGRASAAAADPSSPTAPARSPADPVYEPAEKALGLRKEAPKEVTPPDGYEVVLHKDALDEGQIIEIIISGKAIAVAKVDGSHHAIANTCPHAGGPLGDGKMKDGIVSCPYHGYKYDLRDGTCKTNPALSVQKFDVRIVGDAVCVAT